MLLGLQKKISFMLGEFHEGIVDVGTVAETVLDQEFLATMNISRAKKDVFLEILEEVVKDTSFKFWEEDAGLMETEAVTEYPGDSPIQNEKELLMWVKDLRKGIQTAKDPAAYTAIVEPVLREILRCCTQENVQYRWKSSVMRDHAGIYSARMLWALLES